MQMDPIITKLLFWIDQLKIVFHIVNSKILNKYKVISHDVAIVWDIENQRFISDQVEMR